MDIISIRGAITADANTENAIKIATLEMFDAILQENNLTIENIINIQFSMTKDLNAIYPAKVLREKYDLTYTPLFCTQEADVINSLEKTIRVLILAKSCLSKQEVKHVYLKDASFLRPDLKN